jgi:hypothetical protein
MILTGSPRITPSSRVRFTCKARDRIAPGVRVFSWRAPLQRRAHEQATAYNTKNATATNSIPIAVPKLTRLRLTNAPLRALS